MCNDSDGRNKKTADEDPSPASTRIIAPSSVTEVYNVDEEFEITCEVSYLNTGGNDYEFNSATLVCHTRRIFLDFNNAERLRDILNKVFNRYDGIDQAPPPDLIGP